MIFEIPSEVGEQRDDLLNTFFGQDFFYKEKLFFCRNWAIILHLHFLVEKKESSKLLPARYSFLRLFFPAKHAAAATHQPTLLPCRVLSPPMRKSRNDAATFSHQTKLIRHERRTPHFCEIKKFFPSDEICSSGQKKRDEQLPSISQFLLKKGRRDEGRRDIDQSPVLTDEQEIKVASPPCFSHLRFSRR